MLFFLTVLCKISRLSNNLRTHSVKGTPNSLVRICLIRHHGILPNHKHQEAVFHVLLSYLLSSFPALLLFPQIAWVISPPNSLPQACSKGSFIHTVPLIFHSIKTLPVLWFFKQAWVSNVLEKKKKPSIISLPLTSITIHPRMSWVAQSSAGLWESSLRFAGLLNHSRPGLLDYVWLIFSGGPVCPSLKAAVMESGCSPVCFH